MKTDRASGSKNSRAPRPHTFFRETGSTFLSRGTATSLLLLTITGCVVAPESTETSNGSSDNPDLPASQPSEPGDREDVQPIASSTTTATDPGSELQIDVFALERLENNLVRLELGVTNNSSESFSLVDGLSQEGDQNTASHVSLIDSENQKRYLSYDQSNGKCFCSPPVEGSLQAGETVDMWVIYPEPPPELESMTIVTALAPPLLDVPLGYASESIENEGLAEPEILDLTMISDNLEDQTGRTESGDEVSIILSSDVLFETNSATLSPEAEEILEQVATEIDDATSATVNIDGHADNTGNDSINLPLSEERAEAVESTLSELVTRNGISYESEGHGSSDPIADNSSEEGRERNRRVSVTFEK
ncbi:OmpA family protein [Nocardiopsis sp. NPDC006198]|uniref:OmpA family protein n=1 Tax=Nocardiopsis sp. NPDC006198 TaxID=3154472 RepID=UPI0033B3170E